MLFTSGLFAAFGKRFAHHARRPPPAKTIQSHDTPPRAARRAFPVDLSLFCRPFFTVDRCVPQCYKPQKDKLFGGESPNELPSAVRE
jgi:hypothetical protein